MAEDSRLWGLWNEWSHHPSNRMQFVLPLQLETSIRHLRILAANAGSLQASRPPDAVQPASPPMTKSRTQLNTT